MINLKSEFFRKSDLHNRLAYEIANMIIPAKAGLLEMQFNRLFGASLLLPTFVQTIAITAANIGKKAVNLLKVIG